MRRRFTGNKAFDIDINNYFTVVALEDDLYVYLSNNTCEYCIDGDGNWLPLSANTTTKTISAGHTLSFRGDLTKPSFEYVNTFGISKKCNLKGNIMSMLFGDDAATNISLNGKNYAFYKLFYNCTNIIDTSELKLPATTLARRCYDEMFYGCSSLTTAPELPATTLADGCYSNMFQKCTNLTTAPELPATTLTSECYYWMFYGCSKLNYIEMLATDISASSCLTNWVQNVSSTGTFVKNPAMTTLPTGASGIPSRWTIKNDGDE